MLITMKLAFGEQSTLRLLNWLADENARLIEFCDEQYDEGKRPDLLPCLYESGVVYRREKRETWCDYLALLAQGPQQRQFKQTAARPYAQDAHILIAGAFLQASFQHMFRLVGLRAKHPLAISVVLALQHQMRVFHLHLFARHDQIYLLVKSVVIPLTKIF